MYSGDLTVAELGLLEVAELRFRKAVCVTPSGAKVFIPTAHLMVVPPLVPVQREAQPSDGE